jgi:hypothetical protein
LGVQPHMWTCERYPNWPLKTDLLLHSLSRATHLIFKLERWLATFGGGEAARNRPLPEGWIWRCSINGEPTSLRSMYRAAFQALDRGDWSCYPSLFPGDRSVVMITKRAWHSTSPQSLPSPNLLDWPESDQAP